MYKVGTTAQVLEYKKETLRVRGVSCVKVLDLGEKWKVKTENWKVDSLFYVKVWKC